MEGEEVVVDQTGPNESYESYFEKLIAGIPGATAAVVADRDGVPIVRVGEAPEEQKVSTMAASFSVSADQASKLRIGKCKTIINMFSEYSVVHINHLPLVISLFGTTEANIGLMVDIAEEIKATLNPLRIEVETSLELQ